jgi:hypothetical protein
MHLEPDAERHLLLQVTYHRRLRLPGVLLRMNAHVHLRARVGRDGVHRIAHRRHVDPDDGDPRPGPHPRTEAAGADQRLAVHDLGQGAELLLGVARPGPLLTPQPVHRDVAPLVV